MLGVSRQTTSSTTVRQAALAVRQSIGAEHLYAIDLLRFFAAMAVVSCHWCFSPDQMQPIMKISVAKYGLFGVQLFFLISGLVILTSAQGQDFRGFLVARIVRLYPAFWICCTISASAAFIDPLLGWPEYLYNMTMFPDPHYVPLINQAYWSLVVEAKFYLLISVLLLFGWLHRIELVMWIWIVATAFSSSIPMRQLLIAHYACFFVGGCACFLLRKHPTWDRWALLFVAWVVAVNETVRECVEQHNVADAFTSCMLVSSFFAGILAISKNWLVIPAWKGVATLGAISYPIYLLHQRIAVEMGWTTNSPGLLLLAFAWIIVLSWAVHRWGELPLRRWMKAKFDNARKLNYQPPSLL
jgi:peptidoglycan/LPS O-acetylase OafA/YrhL